MPYTECEDQQVYVLTPGYLAWRLNRFETSSELKPEQHDTGKEVQRMPDTQIQDLELKKLKLDTKWKLILGSLGILVIAPLTTTLLWSVLGLLAVILGGGIGLAAIAFAPVFSMKLANARIKAIMAEADKNPIETMIAVDIARTQELAEKDQHLEDWDTELSNFYDEVIAMKKEYPEEACKYQRISAQMHDAIAEARKEQTQARRDLYEFEQAIRKAKILYKMGLAAQRVTAFSKSAEEKVLENIKTEIAFDSVRSNLNRSFARLNTAMARRQERPALVPTAMPQARSTAGAPAASDTISGDSGPSSRKPLDRPAAQGAQTKP
jgi:hypothetical protein